MREQGGSGFTLVEVLIAIFLFSILSVGFYQVMFSGVSGSDVTRDIADSTEEARLGFGRMVRETREADSIESAGPDSYSILIDYDGDGDFEENQYEYVRFSFDDSTSQITLSALDPDDGSVIESGVLMDGVSRVGTTPMFSYSSNLLQYDTDGDGVTEQNEIDAATGVGNSDGVISGAELDLVSSVEYSLRSTSGDRGSDFSTEAQIRNRRFRQ